jgi:hypothetical protein
MVVQPRLYAQFIILFDLLIAKISNFYNEHGLHCALESFPPCYYQSPRQLCLEISISLNSRSLLQFLELVKEKGGKPDTRKQYPLPYGLRNRCRQCCGSGSGLKLVLDPNPNLNPDPNRGFGSRSETGQNFFFELTFLHSLIFKHKMSAFSQFRDLATKVRNKFAGFGSGSIGKRYGSADPYPYQNVTDPQLCINYL